MQATADTALVETRRAASPSPGKNLSLFRRALLAWYDQNRRDLPWRKTRDPYRIWISEIMLQQTRVAAVLEHYRLFLQRFPNVQTLAAASESAVLAAWSGLGYYRRARMLRHCAQKIVAQHRGRFPQTSEALQTLPGIGRYTAAAIASIAFAEPVAVVDGNVERLLQRLAGTSLTSSEMWQRAQSLLSRSCPADFNQSMMELGAIVCTPRQPKCNMCPIRKWCATQGEAPEARAITSAMRNGGMSRGMSRGKPSSGGTSQLSPALQRGVRTRIGASPRRTAHAAAPASATAPILRRRPVSRRAKTEICCVLDQRSGQVRLVQRPRTASLMAGMWELPQWPRRSRRIPDSTPWRTFRHSITVTDYTVHVVRTAAPAPQGKWIPIAKLSHVPLTGLTRKILKAAAII